MLAFKLTIKIIQLSSKGTQTTVDINSPLLSKYCWREKDFQLMAAYSLINSEQYVITTKEQNLFFASFVQ